MRRNLEPSAADFDLHHDPQGRLVLVEFDGAEHVDIEPTRAFPITAPRQRISLRNREGHELRWIEDLADLPPRLAQLLDEELGRREFMPVIKRILRMTAYTEPSQWEVETDRGRTQFLLANEDDVHRLEGHRAVIIDNHGTRYLIPDTRALDAQSRRILERYL